MFTYRTNGPWGAGTLEKLTKAQFDGNTWETQQRLAALEAIAIAANNVIGINRVGNSMVFVFEDYTEISVDMGDPLLPFAGEWLPDTFYQAKKWISTPLGLYEINVDHTTDPYSFDPEATNGETNLYNELLPIISNIPSGGAPGSVLRKADYNDYVTLWQSFADFVDDIESELDLSAIGLPLPTPTTLGGVFSYEPVATEFLTGIDTDGTPLGAQPDFSDLSGSLSVAQTRYPAVYALATSGTISLDPDLGVIFSMVPSGDATINAASAPVGAKIYLIITTSGTTSWTITFGTNFKSTGTLATGTVTAKKFVVCFICDGVNFNEESRTTAM